MHLFSFDLFWFFCCRSDASVDALVTSPCSDNGVSGVVGAGEGDPVSAKPGNGNEPKCTSGDVGCKQDESISRNLVKYGELIILG